ncbi:hypothetical protein GJ699_07435 [Duganella sp. FT80W]|uniref:C-deglycosylation enzyme beta subunit n=1 Tax=Duganella guangzhouensis TaxID=2666084 RepID=A0A6I2KW84_9BURK|nr:DUF6379 domain-containing protein [Duganella guangzhouensis]MRW89812.1 hypothetical protein [Duganella guangzhouensis]
MYDQHIIYPASLRNTAEGGNVTGFSLGARLPYYRGQPLSVVEDVAVTVDGNKVAREQVRFSVRGKTWSLDQLEEATTERWEFGEVADILVAHPGGLSTGQHQVSVAVQLRISYLPWSSVTTCTRQEALAE